MHRIRLILVLMVTVAAIIPLHANPFFGASDSSGETSVDEPAPETPSAEASRTVNRRQSWLRSSYATVRQRLIRYQRDLNNSLADLLAGAGDGPLSVAWLVLGMSFLYGIAHAVLPGHRKTVIVSYYLSEDAKVLHGVGAGFAFALMHVISAVLVVTLVVITVQAATMRAIGDVTDLLQTVSSLLIIAIGGFLLYRKIRVFRDAREERVARTLESQMGLNDRRALDAHVSRADIKSLWPVIVSAGLVPCPVTTSVLLFSISFGVLSLGVVAVIALSLGLGIALSAIAVLTIFFRERILHGLRRLTGHSWQHVVELVGAGSIVVFGLLTLLLVGGLP